MLKVHDKIVYPMYGAGIVTEKKVEKILDEEKELLKIKLIHSEMEVLVPIEMVEKNCIRKVSDTGTLDKAFKTQSNYRLKMTDDEYKEIIENVNDIINRSDLLGYAEWLRKLVSRRRTQGQLNASEKKLYITFKSLLAGEIALIKKIEYGEAEKMIDKAFRKSLKASIKEDELENEE